MPDSAPGDPAAPLPVTSYAVLGLLAFGEELSGYDLKKWADWSIRFFYWSPSFSQIYSQLKRLAGLGYVQSRVVETGGVQDRRLYSITAQGKDVVRRWVAESEMEPTVLKHSLMLRVWLGHLATPERLEELLDEHLTRVIDLAERAASHEVGARRGTWAYPELALRWSQRYYRAERELTEQMLADLRELSGQHIDESGHPRDTAESG